MATKRSVKRSNKPVAQDILATTKELKLEIDIQDDINVDRKITFATEGFTTKFCELVLKDRNRLSKENALIVAEYIIAMKKETNPRPSYIRNTIQFLSELSRSVDIDAQFKDMTQEDILHYLEGNRKLDYEDPLHKWIGSYNTKRIVLFRFFKWLYYPDIANPDLLTVKVLTIDMHQKFWV